MTECLNADDLTTLSGALRWDVDAALEHVATCATCRTTLRQIALLHGTLTVSEPMSEEWLAETCSMIDREAAPAAVAPLAPTARKPNRAPAALLAVVAAAITVLLLLPAPAGPSTPFSPVLAGVFAVLVGTAVGGYYARPPRGLSADSTPSSMP